MDVDEKDINSCHSRVRIDLRSSNKEGYDNVPPKDYRLSTIVVHANTTLVHCDCCHGCFICDIHYNDIIMSSITSQIIVYSTVYSDADQRKHQSSASLAFVRGIPSFPSITHSLKKRKFQRNGNIFHFLLVVVLIKWSDFYLQWIYSKTTIKTLMASFKGNDERILEPSATLLWSRVERNMIYYIHF